MEILLVHVSPRGQCDVIHSILLVSFPTREEEYVPVQHIQPAGLDLRRGGPQVRGQRGARVRRFHRAPAAARGDSSHRAHLPGGDRRLAQEHKRLQRVQAGGEGLQDERGQPGQEPVAGCALHDFWSGGRVQVRDQDCDLPAEPLPCRDHDPGEDDLSVCDGWIIVTPII